jgi:hypothetical protein
MPPPYRRLPKRLASGATSSPARTFEPRDIRRGTVKTCVRFPFLHAGMIQTGSPGPFPGSEQAGPLLDTRTALPVVPLRLRSFSRRNT